MCLFADTFHLSCAPIVQTRRWRARTRRPRRVGGADRRQRLARGAGRRVALKRHSLAAWLGGPRRRRRRPWNTSCLRALRERLRCFGAITRPSSFARARRARDRSEFSICPTTPGGGGFCDSSKFYGPTASSGSRRPSLWSGGGRRHFVLWSAGGDDDGRKEGREREPVCAPG